MIPTGTLQLPLCKNMAPIPTTDTEMPMECPMWTMARGATTGIKRWSSRLEVFVAIVYPLSFPTLRRRRCVKVVWPNGAEGPYSYTSSLPATDSEECDSYHCLSPQFIKPTRSHCSSETDSRPVVYDIPCLSLPSTNYTSSW